MKVSPEQHAAIFEELREALNHAGDVVEAGCNEGSTSRLLADWLDRSGRELHLFDSFEGLPEECGFAGLMATSQTAVESAICEQLNCESLPDWVRVHAGWFRDTMPHRLPPKICFAFLDCDVYESMIDAIKSILPRLTGVMVLHDYTHERWGAGVQRAIADCGLLVTAQAGMAVAWKADQC